MADPKHVEALRAGVLSWNAWRTKQPTVTPDLSGADLALRDLRQADLHHANLSEADLGGSLLSGAILTESTLRDARLEGAILSDATVGIFDVDFYGVDPGDRGQEIRDTVGTTDYLIRSKGSSNWGPQVQGFQIADLSGSILEGADLSRAILAGVVLRASSLARATFGRTLLDCDLGGASGLDEIKHNAPSQITNRSIASLVPPLPERFLRGIGLQDWQIISARTHRVSDYFSCFISYSHEDARFATLLHDRLQAKGIRCWLDRHQMLPGDDIYEQVDRGIKLWDKTLLCCSRASLTSWWVDNEIDVAFEKERALMKERGRKTLALIPVDLDGYLFSAAFQSGKKQQLASRLAADFLSWESDGTKFERGFERLSNALRADTVDRETPPPKKL
jgi:uncharacterized protein YjbI with pentapeptide repeats